MNKQPLASLATHSLIVLAIALAPAGVALAGTGSNSSNALPSVLSSGSGAKAQTSNPGAPGESGQMPMPSQPSWTPPPTPSMGESIYTNAPSDAYSIGRQVVYQWTPYKSYTILTRPGAVTDIIMADGERPEHLALGDTSRWMVQKTSGDVFIKPIQAGLYTSATLVTTQHRYQLLLVSVPPGSPWYQSVAWRSPGFSPAGTNMLAFSNSSGQGAPSQQGGTNAPQSNRGGNAVGQDGTGAQGDQSQGAFGLVQAMDVAYRIHGDASWRPVKVFSIHHKTYIEFPKHTENLPALFVKPSSGVPFSLGNYVVRGGYIVYPHLFHKAMLRLGGRAVYITRLNRSKG